MKDLFYPYFLYVVRSTDGGKDADGNYTESVDTEILLGKCRDEAAGGKTISLPDGTILTYNSLIQVDEDADLPNEGETVIVKNSEGATRVKKKALVIRDDFFHKRIWV